MGHGQALNKTLEIDQKYELRRCLSHSFNACFCDMQTQIYVSPNYGNKNKLKASTGCEELTTIYHLGACSVRLLCEWIELILFGALWSALTSVS